MPNHPVNCLGRALPVAPWMSLLAGRDRPDFVLRTTFLTTPCPELVGACLTAGLDVRRLCADAERHRDLADPHPGVCVSEQSLDAVKQPRALYEDIPRPAYLHLETVWRAMEPALSPR
jgi:hypothetical protein